MKTCIAVEISVQSVWLLKPTFEQVVVINFIFPVSYNGAKENMPVQTAIT